MPNSAEIRSILNKMETFDWARWNASLAKKMGKPYRDLVTAEAVSSATKLGVTLSPTDPLLTKFVTKYVGERVKQLNGTTKKDVIGVIRSYMTEEQGENEPSLRDQVLGAVRERFEGYEEWRAQRIARTETAIGYNHANVLGYAQAGVEKVEIADGTDDDVCAEANGTIVTLAEALADPLGHPNCTRAMLPIVEDNSLPRRLEHMFLVLDEMPAICALVSETIASLDDPCAATRVLESFEDEDDDE